MSKMENHSFMCMNCGRESLPLLRPRGHERGKFHRKRLYCPWCKTECNHIEVRNEEEKTEFLKKFNNGDFKEELKETLNFCKEN